MADEGVATGPSRRALLGTVGGALGVGVLGRARIGASGTADGGGSVGKAHLTVDSGPASDWRVDRRLFGKFFEPNGRDAYPGIVADHVANGSFEVWNRSGQRTAVLYPDVDGSDGLAYPWEPVESTGTRSPSFDQPPGGIHGRRAVPDLEGSPAVPEEHRPDPAGIARPRFQRIHVDGAGGARQRTALPDGRTLAYDVRFSVRGDVDSCTVGLADPAGSVRAQSAVPVTDEWVRHEVRLALPERTENRYRGSPFGEYALSFEGTGSGRLDLDRTMLLSGDAVEGLFNPTTIRRLREFNVTALRWGGNFLSQYRWRDGIGPLADRPVVPNGNWGGLERNYLGTNEFLRFCELADVEPLLTVGSWAAIAPAEAAAWVEYVNGDRSTDLGALRADHGYPEPWGVTDWQVGNEVYGAWQIGTLDATAYARRFEAFHDAMTAVDPDVTVSASGVDPTDDWHATADASVSADTESTWNAVLFDRAGDRAASVDVHRYTAGLKSSVQRWLWRLRTGRDPVAYNRDLVCFPTTYERVLDDLAGRAGDLDVGDLEVLLGEWNLQPAVEEGWPRAGYPTMAHAAAVASVFNAAIRGGDVVRGAYQRDNTLFSRPYPRDMRPVNPGNYVQRYYAEPFVARPDGWHAASVGVDAPEFTVVGMNGRVPAVDGVPAVDAAGLRAAADDALLVFVVNRDLRDAHTVTLDRPGWVPAGADSDGDGDESWRRPVQVRPAGGDPFAEQTSWTERNGFEVVEPEVSSFDDADAGLSLPPASVARLGFRPA
jgi:alpha-N-arabinofuranosidase